MSDLKHGWRRCAIGFVDDNCAFTNYRHWHPSISLYSGIAGLWLFASKDFWEQVHWNDITVSPGVDFYAQFVDLGCGCRWYPEWSNVLTFHRLQVVQGIETVYWGNFIFFIFFVVVIFKLVHWLSLVDSSCAILAAYFLKVSFYMARVAISVSSWTFGTSAQSGSSTPSASSGVWWAVLLIYLLSSLVDLMERWFRVVLQCVRITCDCFC